MRSILPLSALGVAALGAAAWVSLIRGLGDALLTLDRAPPPQSPTAAVTECDR